MPERGFTTRALDAWRLIDDVAEHAASPPIYQSATFIFDDIDSFASVGQTKTTGGYLYSRWANPTVEAFARTLAALEGAEATACFSSGMAAITCALQTHLQQSDHVVSSAQLYGGTHGLYTALLARAGVEVTKVNVSDVGAIEDAFTERTKVLYCETISNPTMNVADLDALAKIAGAHGALFIVDSTFTPPALLRPLEHGADVVCHSATKYIAGHADVTAGVASGSAQAVAAMRALSMDTGAILSPFEAWLAARGLQTLDLRMDRICSNSLALAQMLEAHPAVERVHYPGLPSHPDHELATQLLGNRFGGMLSFEVAGGVEGGRRVLERVRVAAAAASLGATQTLIVHPASVTHTQLTSEQRHAVGIADGMIRLSVGIEDQADLLGDFDQALG